MGEDSGSGLSYEAYELQMYLRWEWHDESLALEAQRLLGGLLFRESKTMPTTSPRRVSRLNLPVPSPFLT